MAKSPNGGGNSNTLQLDPAAEQALQELTRSIETANRDARSAGLIGAQRAVGAGMNTLPADVLQLVVAAATTAAARNPGGGAGQVAKAERAAKDAVESYARVLSVRAAGERHSAGLTGAVREAVVMAARQAGAAGGSVADAERAANRAAEKAAAGHKSGLVAAQKDLFSHAGTLSKFGFHGMAGTMSKVGQMGAGLGELGMPGAGALLSRAALPIAIIQQIASNVKLAAELGHDEYLTQGQRGRAIAKSLPFGETAVDWVDTVSGRKRAMARADEEGQRGQIRTETEIEKQRVGQHYQAMHTSAKIRADVLQSSGPVLMPHIDRSTAAGQKQYELESRLLPVREKLASAERESQIAGREAVAAQQRENELTARGVKLAQERAELEKKLAPKAGSKNMHFTALKLGLMATNPALNMVSGLVEGHSEGPERSRVLHELANKDKEIAANNEDQRQNAEVKRGALDRKANADAGVARAQAAQSRVMSEHYGAEADTAEESAIRLASMSPGQRAMAQRSLDAIKKDPTIVLRSQWHAQQASQIDSKYVRKVLAQQGQTTAEYKKGVAEGLPSFPGYVKDLREKQTEEANKATKQDFKADQDLAKSLGETILPAYEKTLKLIAEKMDTMLAEFEVKLKMSRNAS